MAHAQKPDFVFRRNGRVHLNRRGRQFSRLLAAKVCASAFIAGSNAGYTVFRGSVKGTGYPLHSPVSPSLPLTCVTVCHHILTGVYYPGWGAGYGWGYWAAGRILKEVWTCVHLLHEVNCRGTCATVGLAGRSRCGKRPCPSKPSRLALGPKQRVLHGRYSGLCVKMTDRSP